MPNSRSGEKFGRLDMFEVVEEFRKQIFTGAITRAQAKRLLKGENPFMPRLVPLLWRELTVGGETPRELMARLEAKGKLCDIEELDERVDLDSPIPQQTLRFARCKPRQLGFESEYVYADILSRVQEVGSYADGWAGAYLALAGEGDEPFTIPQADMRTRTAHYGDEFGSDNDRDVPQLFLPQVSPHGFRWGWTDIHGSCPSIVFLASSVYVDGWKADQPFSYCSPIAH